MVTRGACGKIFLAGVFLLVSKVIIFASNHFFNANITILEAFPGFITSFLPLILMLIGGIGRDQLKDNYI